MRIVARQLETLDEAERELVMEANRVIRRLGGDASLNEIVNLCREAGKLRVEGKDYVVQDGDVVHFRFNV